jgi:nitroimidazol reductase NimA-like FMN-containing flavoprotein (pyridoxamine 5'-phosphate oxidase superfamily)
MERSFLGLIELSEEQCRELLDRHRRSVGRVAFADDRNPDWPTILPVNYVWAGGDIYFRTFEGSKLFAALRRQRVAFEVDEVDDDLRCGWSVVVVGPLDIVRGDYPSAVRSLQSWAGDKPEHVVRLQAQQITGREVIGPRE